jgi:hypothetical protein
LFCFDITASPQTQNNITDILLENEINKKLLLFEIKNDSDIINIKIEKLKPSILEDIKDEDSEYYKSDSIDINENIIINDEEKVKDKENLTVNISDISHIYIDESVIKDIDEQINDMNKYDDNNFQWINLS